MFLSLPLLSCESSVSLKENPDRKKSNNNNKKKQIEWKDGMQMSLVFLALNIKLLLFFFLLCVKVVNTCKIHALLLTKVQGQFIELHKTQLVKRLGHLTWDCIVPFFLIKILENWWLPSPLKAFIWKKNVGSKNIQIHIYSRVPNKRPPTTAYFFFKKSSNLSSRSY